MFAFSIVILVIYIFFVLDQSILKGPLGMQDGTKDEFNNSATESIPQNSERKKRNAPVKRTYGRNSNAIPCKYILFN